MHNISAKFIIYGNGDKYEILTQLGLICRDIGSPEHPKEELIKRVYEQIKNILRLSTDYGFNRNLWHSYLTFLLMTDENPFSLTCEKTGAGNGSVNIFAKNDYSVFMELFNYDFSEIESILGISCFSIITDYTAIEKKELMYNKNVSIRVASLCEKLESCANVD